MTCEVCGQQELNLRLMLGDHPLCDDLVDPLLQIEAARYRQEVVLCTNCLTVHQAFPVNKETLFKPSYHYRSRLTNDVLAGMDDLVSASLKLRRQGPNDRVLDIGCNDGSLLRLFKERGLTTVGVDPTSSIFEDNGAIDFRLMEFFSPGVAKQLLLDFGTFEYITLTNVFAHIEDFSALCIALKMLIGPDTLVVIENHYLGSVLEMKQFDTFYHEHPRTYSAKSFEVVSQKLACPIVDLEFPKRYGGNIRVTLSRSEALANRQVVLPDESGFPSGFESLQQFFENWRVKTAQKLAELASVGNLAGKALPGRAVMLISSLELSSDVMPAVFEKPGSPKIGMLVPGTDIPIVSDEHLIGRGYTDLVVWAWHIVAEVTDYLRAIGYAGRIWSPMPTFHLVEEALPESPSKDVRVGLG